MERLTKQRKYIIEALKDLGHATFDDIEHYLSKNNLHLSLATLYRNISSLSKDGIIRKVDCSLPSIYYELKEDIRPHNHFICLKCHKIIDIENTNKYYYIDENDNEVFYQTTNSYGYCKECRCGKNDD